MMFYSNSRTFNSEIEERFYFKHAPAAIRVNQSHPITISINFYQSSIYCQNEVQFLI